MQVYAISHPAWELLLFKFAQKGIYQGIHEEKILLTLSWSSGGRKAQTGSKKINITSQSSELKMLALPSATVETVGEEGKGVGL